MRVGYDFGVPCAHTVDTRWHFRRNDLRFYFAVWRVWGRGT